MAIMKYSFALFCILFTFHVVFAQLQSGTELIPQNGVSLPYATITNKKLASYINNQIIEPLAASSQRDSYIEIYSWKEKGTNREIVSISILPSSGAPLFVYDLDNKRKEINDIYVIPNAKIKIYAVSKEKGNWIKKTGRYTAPLRWHDYLCIDENNLRIRLYVTPDSIELKDIERETPESYSFFRKEALIPKD